MGMNVRVRANDLHAHNTKVKVLVLYKKEL
jgi:hypothetical protein